MSVVIGTKFHIKLYHKVCVPIFVLLPLIYSEI